MPQEIGKKLVDSTFFGAIGYGLATGCNSSISSLQNSTISYIYKLPPILEILKNVNALFVATACVLFSVVNGVARSITDEVFPDQCNDPTFILSRVTISVLTAAGASYLLGLLPSFGVASGYIGASIAAFAIMKSAAIAIQ